MHRIEAEKIQGFAETGYYFQRTGGRVLSNQLHTHTFYEFLYVVSGSCVHETNGEQAKLCAGDMVFLIPQASHRFLSQDENTDVIALSVMPKEIRTFFAFYGIGEFSRACAVLKLPIEKRQTLLALCEAVIPADPGEYLMRIRMVFNQLFLFCMEPIPEKPYLPADFASALDKMQELSAAAEGLCAFLRISGYSHSQLCRLTNKYLGMTPCAYINHIRMRHAYRLIVDGSLDYETICDTVGLSSFSYFCKLVKKTFGCSPSKLRNGFQDMRKTV